MDWILDNLQIVVIALFVFGSMVKSVIESKTKRAQEEEADWDPESEVPLDDDKSYRKPTTFSPPPLPRDPALPPLRETGYDAAIANETAKALKHQQDLAERLRLIRETKATTTGGAAATRARVAAKGAAKPFPSGPLSVRNRLRDPAEVRRAFVMREILDPPVGLR